MALEKYADNSSLGRFALRSEGLTIAVGQVTKYHHNTLPLFDETADYTQAKQFWAAANTSSFSLLSTDIYSCSVQILDIRHETGRG